jgi:hypothetical protein
VTAIIARAIATIRKRIRNNPSFRHPDANSEGASEVFAAEIKNPTSYEAGFFHRKSPAHLAGLST